MWDVNQYADKEARELLIQRAWNLPWLSRLIDVGLTIFDFAKIRDNEQMTWREYLELERKIAEAERKLGIDPSDAIRKAQKQLEEGPETLVDIFERDETTTEECKWVLLESFYGRCEILPMKSGVTHIHITYPEKNVKFSFTHGSLLNSYDGIAKIDVYYYSCDKSKSRVVASKDGTVLFDVVVTEKDVVVERTSSTIAGDLFKEGNWWIFLLIGVGILLLVFLLRK